MPNQSKSRLWAIVQFPGSNCDHDVLKVFEDLAKDYPTIQPVMHWHEDPITPKTYEVIVLPGGFSYGDYLRAGAIAKISTALKNLDEVVEAGAHVMGICNGFQILLETRLLPGYLQVNQSLRFISDHVDLSIDGEAFPWFSSKNKGQTVRYPIAHRFGNYQLSSIDRAEMKPVLRYEKNPNGSHDAIAGIYRSYGKGSVFGLMPHPERAAFAALKLTDGIELWKNAAEALA
jgi:phosphoribosylformylglycinamidine synthase I